MRKMIAFIVVVLIAMAQAILPAFSFGETVDQTASTTATATKPEDIDISSPILDDFEDNGVINRWGGNAGPWQANGATCNTANATFSPHFGTFSLMTAYNVDAGNSYSGYYSLFSADATPSKNISNYKQLTFYVRGVNGGELFKVEMKNNSGDSNRNTAYVYVNDFLAAGSVITGWKQAVIPLHNFVNIDNWTNAREFVVTFENTASTINGTQTHGVIYLDDISFSASTPAVVYVDRFSDKIDRCMLGGIMGPMGDATRNYTSSSGSYNSEPYGLLLQYNLPLHGWGGAYFIFGGGGPGNTPIAHDFTGYNYLKFWVKAMGATANPKKVMIELRDNGGLRTYWVTTITTSAQTIKIPLTSFAGLQKTSIKQLNFVFDYDQIQSAGGNTTGGIYIDDIRFDTVN